MLFLITPEDSTESLRENRPFGQWQEGHHEVKTGRWQGAAKVLFWLAASLALTMGIALLH